MNVFLKTIRLRTGDVIACGLEDNFTLDDLTDKKYITLHNPVTYTSFKFIDPKTDQLVDTTAMSPFNGITGDHEIQIKSDEIISINSIRDGARERYLRFLQQLDAYNVAGDMVPSTVPTEDELEEMERMEALLQMPTSNVLH